MLEDINIFFPLYTLKQGLKIIPELWIKLLVRLLTNTCVFFHSFSLRLGVVVFAAISKRNRIEAEVAVDMFLVKVCGDDDFKAVAPHFLC